MATDVKADAASADRARDSSLYRAVWRWHFFAGLLVLPVLLLLAVTGALYLYQPEIDRALYGDMMHVAVQPSQVPPTTMMHNAEAALNGRLLQLTLPAEKNRAATATVRIQSGEPRTVYLDPYDGQVTGHTAYRGIMQLVRKIHSLQQFGFWASSVVEIAAGWAIILVFSGVFLWWPRGRSGGVVTVRETPRKRTFWRDLHAVTGVFSGAVIVFLAVTGMPWSMFWGEKVQSWASAKNLSTPAPPAEVTPAFLLGREIPGSPTEPHQHHSDVRTVPWSLEQARAPESVASNDRAISLDSALVVFAGLGILKPMGVQLPESPRGAYVATHTPGNTRATRTVYLDQYSGKVLADVGFDDNGPVAKAVEWGIAVHMGAEFGVINRFLMLLGCFAIVLLVISAPVMWWKRRPAGRLGAPPLPANRNSSAVVLGLIAIAGVIFPLVGLSLIAALLVDFAWQIGARLLSAS